jgi:hypothetical protein
MRVSFDFSNLKMKANQPGRIVLGLHPASAQVEEKIAAIPTHIATSVMIYAHWFSLSKRKLFNFPLTSLFPNLPAASPVRAPSLSGELRRKRLTEALSALTACFV